MFVGIVFVRRELGDGGRGGRRLVVIHNAAHATLSKKPHHSCEQRGLRFSKFLNWLGQQGD